MQPKDTRVMLLARRTLLQAAALSPLVLPPPPRGGHGLAGWTGALPARPAEPGPVGDLRWSGVNWHTRTDPGPPQYNERWSGSNVVDHGDGTLTLLLTNAGRSPVGAEIYSTRTGWGYGTYSLEFEGNFDLASPSVVWGNLFTYDAAQPPGSSKNEIDAGEVSAWGVPGIAPRLSASYWTSGRSGVPSHDLPLPAGLRFFRTTMTWLPRSLVFATYAGVGAADSLVAGSSVSSDSVPTPAAERVYVNLWVTAENEDDEAAASPIAVRLTRFSFSPA